jgi:hypothetical protein
MFIDPSVRENRAVYRQAFESARPFRHVVIDNFLVPDRARALDEGFPIFDPLKAIDETGKLGGKAVNEDLVAMGGVYRQLAGYLDGKEFPEEISALTGIGKLRHDPTLYGGGTHENLHGQELDPHIDFNIDERAWYYRRLNVLIYLNQEWEESWGGAIELHSDPRQPDENRVVSFAPTFNRCLIFETNERSWHGFSRIHLPEHKRHLSRKSLSIYLYTEEPPDGKPVASHTTFYVHRPLPGSVQPDRPLTREDHARLKTLLQRRDDLIRFYQEREIEESYDWVSLKSRVKRYVAARHPALWRVWVTFARWKRGRSRAVGDDPPLY